MATFTVDLMFAADKADIPSVSASNMTEFRKRATYAVGVINALNKALVANGLPEFRFNSGWRSYAHLKRLYDTNHGKKYVAKPGTSGHESGGAIDCGIQKNATGGKLMKFAVKWFIENNIVWDQIIDESSGGAYGWLHVGLIPTTNRKPRCQIAVSWGGNFHAQKSYYDYINYRNKATGETTGREAFDTTGASTKFTGTKSYTGAQITVTAGTDTGDSGSSTSGTAGTSATSSNKTISGGNFYGSEKECCIALYNALITKGMSWYGAIGCCINATSRMSPYYSALDTATTKWTNTKACYSGSFLGALVTGKGDDGDDQFKTQFGSSWLEQAEKYNKAMLSLKLSAGTVHDLYKKYPNLKWPVKAEILALAVYDFVKKRGTLEKMEEAGYHDPANATLAVNKASNPAADKNKLPYGQGIKHERWVKHAKKILGYLGYTYTTNSSGVVDPLSVKSESLGASVSSTGGGSGGSSDTVDSNETKLGFVVSKLRDRDPKEASDAYDMEEALLEEELERQSSAIWKQNAANSNYTATEDQEIDSDPEVIALSEDFLIDLDAEAANKLGTDTENDLIDSKVDGENKAGSDSKSVLENSGDNASDVTVKDQNTDRKVPPKIYAMDSVPVTITLDSIELNMNGTQSTIDQSTGLPTNINESNRKVGVQKAVGDGGPYTDNSLSLGQVAPLIRINDKIMTGKDIEYFSLSTTGKMPKILLKINTPDKSIVKKELIKDGDICSVYINMGVGIVKSYRGDFKITNVIYPEHRAQGFHSTAKLTIFGELYIPQWYNNSLTFTQKGSSTDAIIAAAKKLGLTVMTNEPDDQQHNDVQLWQCTRAVQDVQGLYQTTTLGQFIDKTVSHAYSKFNSFYDWWIDPRYGIAFIDMNKQLGADDLDEEVDLAFFKSAYSNLLAVDGNNTEPNASETTNNPNLKLKLFTNISTDDTAKTSFYVTNYTSKMNFDSNATLSRLMLSEALNVKNAGVKSGTKINFKYSLCINTKKTSNGFYVLDGPGLNLTYQLADNGDYSKQHASAEGGGIANIQSDDDAKNISETGSNMLASGNTNKFYTVAKTHNLINNYQLRKRINTLTCNGLNTQIMRGEKVPVLLVDVAGRADIGSQTKNDVLDRILEDYSGWFVIYGITWVYDQNKKTGGTLWNTIIDLVRREWPIPGYTSDKKETDEEKSSEEIVVTTDVNNGTTTESKTDTDTDTSTNTSTNTDTTKLTSDQITTEGLSSDLTTFYTMLNDEIGATSQKIKLISGRRWAADADGNRQEGAPTIEENGSYKFVNANGDIVWYNSKTSAHLYGNAIDIINGDNTAFDDVLETVLQDNALLGNMFEAGIYCAVETSKDDLGNTVKHYHFGKVDQSDSTTMESQKKWWEAVAKAINSSVLTYKSAGKTYTYNIDNYVLGNA